MLPTIQDIARLAGVSPTTVSNVIHGNDRRVSAATRQRIKVVIKAQGYVPNLSARSLKTNTSRIIAMFNAIVPEESGGSLQDPFHSALLTGIERELRGSDYFLMVRSVSSAEELLRYLNNWKVDALIMTGIISDAFYQALRSQAAPFLLVDSYVEGEAGLRIRLEDRQGARLAAEHLLGLGHRDILFCGPQPLDRGVIAERLAGLRETLAEHGIAHPDSLIRPCPMGIDEAVAVGRELALRNDFTAIFATADVLAAGIVSGLQSAGRRVPKDISVVGFDDLAIARLSLPPLTTVRQDVVARGQQGARMLLRALKGESVEALLTPVTLTVRGSTGRLE